MSHVFKRVHNVVDEQYKERGSQYSSLGDTTGHWLDSGEGLFYCDLLGTANEKCMEAGKKAATNAIYSEFLDKFLSWLTLSNALV